MTKEEIIRMAQEAGAALLKASATDNSVYTFFKEESLERFAALVAAHVRETEFKPDWTNYRTDDLPTQDGFPHCPYCGKDI